LIVTVCVYSTKTVWEDGAGGLFRVKVVGVAALPVIPVIS